MRFLPWLVMGAAVTLAVTAEGCADRACLEWRQQAEGACPRQADAQPFFGVCSDVKAVVSEPTFLADMGGLCCYDVTHRAAEKSIPCNGSTTTTTTTHQTTGTDTTTTGTGGAGGTSSTGTSTPQTGGGGASPSCEICDEALMNGNSGNLCTGASSNAFVGLVTCACADCAAACHDFCNVGAAPSDACSTCFDGACPSEVSACTSN